MGSPFHSSTVLKNKCTLFYMFFGIRAYHKQHNYTLFIQNNRFLERNNHVILLLKVRSIKRISCLILQWIVLSIRWSQHTLKAMDQWNIKICFGSDVFVCWNRSQMKKIISITLINIPFVRYGNLSGNDLQCNISANRQGRKYSR